VSRLASAATSSMTNIRRLNSNVDCAFLRRLGWEGAGWSGLTSAATGEIDSQVIHRVVVTYTQDH